MAINSTNSIEILHVDDEPELGRLTADFLERESDAFDVVTAESAAEGMETVDTHEIECIVSDYDMPGQNGIEFLETLRQDGYAIPFILFTGKGSEEIASEAISAGVDDYLQKSSGSEQYALLAQRIRNVVEKHRSEREAAQTRRFFSTIIEHSTDVIPVIDPEGEITYLSPSSEWILGYTPGELVGENAFDYIHEDDVEAATEKFLECLDNPKTMPEITFRFRHADGSWVKLHGRARNLLDDPAVEGIVSYNRVIENEDTDAA